MKRKEKIRSVVVVVIAIAVAVVFSIPASAVAEEVRSDAVELLVVPTDDEAVIEFVRIPRAVVSWDPAEIEIESVAAPRAVVSWDPDEVEVVFVPIPRAVVSWDPSEIVVESVSAPCRPEHESPVQVARFDPDPAVPPTAPHAVVIVPPFPERVRRHPARFSLHPERIAQR